MVTWNLEHIYPFKDTDKLIAELKKKTTEFKKIRTELTPNLTPKRFMEIIKRVEELTVLSSKLGGYAGLWQTENTASDERNAHESKIRDILTELGNETIFFSLWFKNLDDAAAKKFIDASGPYRYFLEHKRLTKDHTLKENEEQIVHLLSSTGDEAFVTMYDIVANRFRFDWEGKKRPLMELTKLYSDKDPNVREKAYKTVLSKYKEEEAILGEIYKTLARGWRNEYLKLRKYKSPISVRNMSNDIPDGAIAALLDVIKDNMPIFQEYFTLKAKLLGMKKPDRFHLYAPYNHQSKEYSYETCKKICLEAYESFSPRAREMAQQIFDQGHVHSDLTENKQSGAFCSTILPSIKPYILLNHVGKVDDLFTMMHEFGHGIHSVAAEHQTVFTQHSALPMAETASIFGELILMKQMLKTATNEEKLYLLAKELDKQYASIGRQAFFVLFEIEAHDMIAKGCTIEELNAAYLKNLQTQFGKNFTVDPIFSHEWKYVPHIYHTPFYCYAYAFGNLLVLALYQMYEAEGKSFVPKYLKILEYGGSASPQTILSEVGIDITSKAFWQKGFEIIKKEVQEFKLLTSGTK